MNIIYMILRMMSVLDEKANAWKMTGIKLPGIKMTVSRIWASPLSMVERMTHNVKIVMMKPLTTLNGSYRSMKRCV